MLRALLGALAAGTIAGFARRRGSLAPSGQWAAFACGIAAAAAGYRWAVLLVAFFAASTALTRWGADEKARRTDAIIPKGSARTATQVLANGGLFVVLAAVGAAVASPRLQIGALGALAAACADTWATEVGTYLGGEPRSVVSWRQLPRGMSGGVTLIGSLAAIGGAAFIALATPWMLHPPAPNALIAVLVGGVAGALGDSLLGATAQSRRWCAPCEAWTERRVHLCGYRTRHAAGLAWLDNDAVNLAATVIGALSAMAVA
jgi:uncharacterized protein (TIGR00297 family)